MSTAVRSALTAAEFFDWEAEQVEKHEFYYGELFSMAGGSPAHARLAAKTLASLERQLEGGPCQTFTSDLAVELDAAGHFVYPDVTVVCGPIEQSAHGPAVTNPTVVVEVLSPSTANWDRGGKFDRYRRLSSLQALVFVATDQPHADTIVREGDRWLLVDPDAEGRLAIDPIGAALDVPTLFKGIELDPTSHIRPS